MTKLPNIIQRRELAPIMLKAEKIAKYYEKASNCSVCIIGTEPPECCNNGKNTTHDLCKFCNERKYFYIKHMEAVCEAKKLGGSFIYECPFNFVFWTSPFYSGERFAGALISGNANSLVKNSNKAKALANMMQICADQISREGSRDTDALFYHRKVHMFHEIINDSKFNPVNVKAETHLNIQNITQTGMPENNQKPKNNICLIDMERKLFANLRRGDYSEGKKILIELLEIQYKKENCNIAVFQLKALELAVLLSRAMSNPNDLNDIVFRKTNDSYLNKIKDSLNYQEITEILLNFLEKISGRIFSFHGVRHFPALRKAERFIWDNYTRKISLEEIAGVSGLSAPYFSTIFREEMGENLSNYLNRLRIEKAAVMLVTTNMSINKIAVSCGFNDQSWFSKIFKTTLGLTPGKYREQGDMCGLSA